MNGVPPGKGETEGASAPARGPLRLHPHRGGRGFTPQEVKDMTMAEFHAAIDGFIAANSPAEQAPTEDEFMRVLAEGDGGRAGVSKPDPSAYI